MANRWCDGFGRYGGDEAAMLNGSSGQAWAEITGAFALSSANPRTGTWHLRKSAASAASSDARVRRVFGAPLTEVFVGFALYCADLPGTETQAGFTDAQVGGQTLGTILGSFRDQTNTQQFWVMLGTDGALDVRRNGVSLGRTIPIIGAGAYQHIEIYAKAGTGTNGALEIRVDEVTRLNLTGISTVLTASVEFSQFVVGHQSGGSNTPQIDFADVFVNDTTADGSACDTWIGDCKSGVLMVTSDTAQADFTLSSGVSGFALLDETPPNDSDYIDTASSTAESDFGVANGPANLSEILTIRPFDRAMKDDAGTCTIAPNVKSNGTKGTVSDQPITTAFAYYDSNVPLDPDTGVPWLPAGLNAIERVVERTA